MKYPQFLQKKGTIGLIAPSFGVSGSPYEERYESAYEKFTDLGYNIKTVSHLRGIKHGKSATARIRAREFEKMYLDDDVDFIISVAGGELMCEILPYIHFDRLKKAAPKYIMGLSDNTCLTFTMPLLTDTAAIYGSCFGSFGMQQWHQCLQECYEVITGKRLSQKNYDMYDDGTVAKEDVDPLEGYNLNQPVVYKSLDKQDHCFSGRLIGGCLDLLVTLIGTPYAPVNEFLEKYKEDGFIWYMEACDLNVLSIYRSLWQLKSAGWFKYCNGIIMGRPILTDKLFGISLKEALKNTLGDLKIPVIYDADFGHVPPNWTIISGSYGTVDYKEGKCEITYELK